MGSQWRGGRSAVSASLHRDRVHCRPLRVRVVACAPTNRSEVEQGNSIVRLFPSSSWPLVVWCGTRAPFRSLQSPRCSSYDCAATSDQAVGFSRTVPALGNTLFNVEGAISLKTATVASQKGWWRPSGLMEGERSAPNSWGRMRKTAIGA